MEVVLHECPKKREKVLCPVSARGPQIYRKQEKPKKQYKKNQKEGKRRGNRRGNRRAG